MLTDSYRNLLLYNALDSFVTASAEKKLWEELHESGFIDTYKRTEDLYGPLLYMAQRGIRVDHDGLRAKSIAVSDEISDLQFQLNKLAGRDLNPNSPKDCMAYFYIEKNIAPYLNRKTGRPTVDDTALQRLAKGTQSRAPIPEAQLVQQIRGLQKLKGTYLDIIFDDDGRLRCFWNPRGTWSGRISSSKTIFGTGMNLQNLPMAFKQFLIPDDGYVLVEIDKKGAEWVVVAFLSGDSRMIQVVLEKKDPHAFTASIMFDVPEEAVIEENEICGHETDPQTLEYLREKKLPWMKKLSFFPRNMSMRQAGKKANHGLNYDERYKTFALLNDMLEADSKRIVSMYKTKVYPGVGRMHRWVQEQLSKNRTLTNCFGRSRRFLGAWGDDLFRQAYAFIPQSTVVDVVNDGIISIYNSDTPALQEVELLAQIHDSVLNQYQIESGWNFPIALQMIKERLDPELEYLGRPFRIGTECKVYPENWASGKAVEIEQGLGRIYQDIRKVFHGENTERLDNRIPEIHGEHRAEEKLSQLDGDFLDSLGITT